MALIFNPVLSGNRGIMAAIYSTGATSFTSTSSLFYSANIYFYPDSVPFPDTSPTTVTAGHIANGSLSTKLSLTNDGNINLSSNLNMLSTGTGNISWWLMHSGTSANNTVCSNSLGTSSGNVIILNTLQVANIGDAVNMTSFNLKLV
jgi:hypothetical protein